MPLNSKLDYRPGHLGREVVPPEIRAECVQHFNLGLSINACAHGARVADELTVDLVKQPDAKAVFIPVLLPDVERLASMCLGKRPPIGRQSCGGTGIGVDASDSSEIGSYNRSAAQSIRAEHKRLGHASGFCHLCARCASLARTAVLVEPSRPDDQKLGDLSTTHLQIVRI